MLSTIEQDRQRFRQIVRGRIRKDLKKFLSQGELIGREGKKFVSIPLHDIDIPTFRYGDNSGGIGMGDGDEGGQGKPGAGDNAGGEDEGRHVTEVDISLEELADILAEELELPRIEPKGAHNITTVKDRYTGVRPVGPSSLRHFKRSYREALKRQLAMGQYDPDDPVIIPIREDMRYRSWNEVRNPTANAAIIYMMDVSGSMGVAQKELVRLTAFWIDTWLRRNYQGIESRYIVHDVRAAEVDRQTFFSMREDGGTRISSAFKLCKELLDAHYDPASWNVYLFHFSDGDNSSESDNRLCVELLRDQLVPASNMVGYCQVSSAYGSGNFISVLREAFGDGLADKDGPRLIATKINGKDDIHQTLRTLFHQGR